MVIRKRDFTFGIRRNILFGRLIAITMTQSSFHGGDGGKGLAADDFVRGGRVRKAWRNRVRENYVIGRPCAYPSR